MLVVIGCDFMLVGLFWHTAAIPWFRVGCDRLWFHFGCDTLWFHFGSDISCWFCFRLVVLSCRLRYVVISCGSLHFMAVVIGCLWVQVGCECMMVVACWLWFHVGCFMLFHIDCDRKHDHRHGIHARKGLAQTISGSQTVWSVYTSLQRYFGRNDTQRCASM